MIQKLEKFDEVWTAVGEECLLAAQHENRKSGATLPLKDEAPAAATAAPAKRGRKPKEAVAEPAAPAPSAAKDAQDAFGLGPSGLSPTDDSIATAEAVAEAKRRCQEVMGLFIRRHLKATPSGLDRAKAILKEVCGRQVSKLEDLTYQDNAQLIPRFEKELV